MMLEEEYVKKIVSSKLLKKSKTDWMNCITFGDKKIVFGNEMFISRIIAKDVESHITYNLRGEETEIINDKGFQLMQAITERAQQSEKLLSFAVKTEEFKKEILGLKKFTGAEKITMMFGDSMSLFYMDDNLKVKKNYSGLINYKTTEHERFIDVDLYLKILNLFELFEEEQISIFHFQTPIPILFKGSRVAVFGFYPKNDYMYFLEGKWF